MVDCLSVAVIVGVAFPGEAMEPLLTLHVGIPSIRLLARMVGLAPSEGAARDLSDIAERLGGLWLTQRQSKRRLEDAAESVAASLREYIELEFRDLAQNDLEAVAIALSHTLQGFDPETGDDLVQIVTDPQALRQRLMESGGHRHREQLYSPSAANLYDLMLQATVDALANVALHLRDFTPHALRALLESDSTLRDLLVQALDALTELGAAHRDKKQRVEALKRRYLEGVDRKYDLLEIAGLDLAPLRRRYSLTDAYVSLSLRPDAESVGEAKDVSIEQLLARERRVLIVGEPGAGKSTIVKWLAVNVARGRFTGGLQDWNAFVPFVIRLRDYATRALPDVGDFGSEIPLAGSSSLPYDWNDDFLTSGRAVVLVDGVDEVSTAKRDEVYLWLQDLVEAFQDAVFVVTTRPTVLRDAPFPVHGFKQAFVQPMGLQQQVSFLQEWHRATSRADDTRPEEADLLALRQELFRNPQLRRLARNPLLCSVTCALHVGRRGVLPRNRSEVYSAALEMLLSRREQAKGLAASPLTESEKTALLSHLGSWLMLNQRSMIDAEEAQTQIGERLGVMRSDLQTVSARDVLRDLVERCGILRFATDDSLEFSHRTFQEYLAARDLVENRHLPLLLGHVEDADWQEVVAWAPAFMSERDASTYLESLFDLIEQAEGDRRRRLILLVIACKETALLLDPSLRRAAEVYGQELVPPVSPDVVTGLVNLGEAALPLLSLAVSADMQQGPLELTVEAMVRIGGEDAMAALAALPSVVKFRVRRRLGEAWANFEPLEYAATVLADVPARDPSRWTRFSEPWQLADRGDRVQLLIRDVESLGAASRVSPAYQLSAELPASELITSEVCKDTELETLRLLNVPEGWDLGLLREADHIGAIYLSFAPPERPNRRIVHKVDGRPPPIGRVHLHAVEPMQLDGRFLRGLCWGATVLEVSGPITLRSLPTQDGELELGELRVSAQANLAWGDLRSSGLSALQIDDWPYRDLGPLVGFPALRSLAILNSPALRTLKGVEVMSELERVELAGCTALEDVSLLTTLPALTFVDLSDCTEVDDAETIEVLRQAVEVQVEGTPLHAWASEREPEVDVERWSMDELAEMSDEELTARGWNDPDGWLYVPSPDFGDEVPNPGDNSYDDELRPESGFIIIENLRAFERGIDVDD